MSEDRAISAWEVLSAEEQIRLRKDYTLHMERTAPSATMDVTVDHFCIWLNERGVHYDP